ncbi:MAG TPA: DoxX family protein [Cyclobacteriaceae bacterium]|nr:DoxX family protein [Cyclobacteriaceae bacterium]
MKKNSVIYWASTAIISGMMLFSALSYLTNDQVKNTFVYFGFPGYFRIELATAKILGALALVIPGIPATIRQFAYFGFAITFLSAFVAHTSVGDTMAHALMPLVFLVILAVSYVYNNKVINLKTN